MNSLQERQQYALATKGKSNNSLFFVKLTDSALQSIEMYLNSKANSSFKPTIQFQESSGTISLPINGRKQNYEFTLSNMEGDGLQGSFQCLKHIHNRSLESLGVMLRKMHIHANEDSYEKTKFKMEAVDKEQKSFCTKEIKPNGTVLSRKYKAKHPGLVLSPNKSELAHRKPEPSKFQLRSKLSNSSILQQSCRKRIIHILAIKPYKKPELLLRLIKEGISDKDKKDFNTILTSVGVLKADAYNLADNLWNEVQEDWEFCTKKELQVIQRRKQQFLKLSSEIEVSDFVTQNNSSTFQKSVSSECVIEKEPLTKKRRISHYSVRNTNHAIKNNSSLSDNCIINRLPTVSNTQTFPDLHHQVNGNSNGSAQRNKDPILTFKKNSCSSQRVKNSCDKINSDNRISYSSPSMSFKKQSISSSNFKIDISKHKNSKKVQEVVMNNSSFNLQNETINHKIKYSESSSKVYAKKLFNTQNHEKVSSRYDYFNNVECVSNETDHANSVSVIDKSKVISPISCNNLSDSSLGNKNVLHK